MCRTCQSDVRPLRPRLAPPTAFSINGVLHRPRRSPSGDYSLFLGNQRPLLCFGMVERSEVRGQVPGIPGLELDPCSEGVRPPCWLRPPLGSQWFGFGPKLATKLDSAWRHQTDGPCPRILGALPRLILIGQSLSSRPPGGGALRPP